MEAVISQALAEGRNLTEPEALELLKVYGFPIVEHRFASSGEEAVEAASAMGYPVALKIVSRDILHKSDAGGVALNICGPDEVKAAFRQVIESVKKHKGDAAINGVLVARMAPPGTEVILGMVRDPQFGPTIMFGLGGVFVEVYKDVSFRILPLTEEDALEMVQEIKGFPLLKGIRGQGPKDIGTIVNGIMRLSRLVQENPRILEIDLNPIVVYEKGCEVLDARIILM